MISEKKTNRSSADDSDSKSRVKHTRYGSGQRFYGALLLFVVIVGLPVVTVPGLRNRLETRVAEIKDAVSGRIEPVVVEVDEEQAPFPEEYERYATSFPGPGEPLPLDRIFTARKEEPDPGTYSPPALITPELADTGKPVLDVESVEEELESDAAVSDPDDGLGYSQGDIEQAAYGLLLESYPKVAEMVEGGDPALLFVSWGAVKRDEDLYWVRLIFQTDENVEVEYIWQVEMESNKVLPLSHNARSIS